MKWYIITMIELCLWGPLVAIIGWSVYHYDNAPRYIESCTDRAVMETLVQPNGCVVYMRLFNRHLRVQTTAVNCMMSIGDISDVTATLVP
jgi:hypothetical protein